MTSLVGYSMSEVTLVSDERSTLYLLGIPRHRADGFPAHVVQGQALLLRLDIPHGDEARIATSNQDVRHLLVPVQTLDVIGTGSGASESVGVRNVVQVGDVELFESISNRSPMFHQIRIKYLSLGASGSQQIRMLRVELKSLDSPGMFRGPRHDGIAVRVISQLTRSMAIRSLHEP